MRVGLLSTAAINGALHPAPGERAHLEALSMRVYLSRPPR